MIPVLTPAQMADVDRNAPEPFDVLIDRAAAKVANAAIDMMGGTYGRRVVVVAGPGNNGEDGRVAADKLRRRGARVTVIDALDAPESISTITSQPIDLVIDAAFGTGFRGEFEFPDVGDIPVLAVDIPSGVSGMTGQVSGRPVPAGATVTFAALKPGLLFGEGPRLAGQVRLVDIGLDASATSIHLVEDTDVAARLAIRSLTAHKWNHAVWVMAGSPGMSGAAHLSCTAALRSGAGYVRHTSVGGGLEAAVGAAEVVSFPLDLQVWADELEADSGRFAAVAIGPGLGTAPETVAAVREVASMDGFPLVIDGDGLNALGESASAILSGRKSATILSPHDREFSRMLGHDPGEDRIASAVELARSSGATVLLKGPTTIVAEPDGSVLLSNSGDERLATAGTGDVLTGIIAAHLASGMEPQWAAVSAAFVHGLAGTFGPPLGLVASDLVRALPRAYAELLSARP